MSDYKDNLESDPDPFVRKADEALNLCRDYRSEVRAAAKLARDARSDALREAIAICRQWADDNRETFHEQALAVDCVRERIEKLAAPAQPATAETPKLSTMLTEGGRVVLSVKGICLTCGGSGRRMLAGAVQEIACPDCAPKESRDK
jgi:hypothetical protein